MCYLSKVYTLHNFRGTVHLGPKVIDKLCTEIGKVFCLYLRIEPFAALIWAMGNVLGHKRKLVTQPPSLASLNSGTGMVLYGRGQLGQLDMEEALPPSLFSPLDVLTLCLQYLIAYRVI